MILRDDEHTEITESSLDTLNGEGSSRPCLVVIQGEDIGKVYEFNRDEIDIGRSSENCIPLNEGKVSRQHAVIRRTGDGYLLDDLGSTNGTFVNGHRVNEVQLVDGDLLSIGRTTLKFVVQAGVESEFHERIYRMATIDTLTGVSNRKVFSDRLKAEFSKAQRYNRPMGLIMIDLDHFKSINDRFGHASGDSVLKEVARRLSENIRKSDLLARFGGEEFAIILPETDLDESARIAEKLRRCMVEPGFIADGNEFSVTISAGVASYQADASDEGVLFSRADRRLYDAKHRGRNQVLIWDTIEDS